MRLLILEDWEPMASAMKELLEARGHDVVTIAGAQTLEPFVGLSPDGRSTLQVDLDTVRLALVDGQLFGKYTGARIVSALSARGIVCVGMSALQCFNDSMIDAGAVLAVNKAILLFAMIDRVFSPSRAVKNPAKEKVRLVKYGKNIEKDASRRQDVIQRADALVKKHGQ